MAGMDEVDRAFLDSLLPEGSVPMGFIAGILFVHPDGGRAWKSYDQLECSLTEQLGLLELMKLELIGRTPSTVRDIGFVPLES